MKVIVSLLALTAFISIGVFGFAAMSSHAGATDHNDCIATVGQVALCPGTEPTEMAQLHAEFFQRLTSTASLALLLVIVAWAFIGTLNLQNIGALFRQGLIAVRRQFLEIAYALRLHSLFSWLSLRQRGDAVFA